MSEIENQQPLVTAVIPVYNHEKYVVESIRSIIAQTYKNIELVVINDGSKDRSGEQVSSVHDECRKRFVRFEYIEQQNRGLAATMNLALKWSTGKYFSGLASDDVIFPNKMEVLVKELELSGESVAAAFGDALFLDEFGRQGLLDARGIMQYANTTECHDSFVKFYTSGRKISPSSSEFCSYGSLLVGNYLPAMANLTRKQAIVEAGGWTHGNPVEDWEMWLKISKKRRIIYLDSPLAFYRIHSNNSIKTMAGFLTMASFAIVLREKQFCIETGQKKIWEQAFNSQKLQVLMSRKIPARTRLAFGIHGNPISFGKFLTGRIISRVAKKYVRVA